MSGRGDGVSDPHGGVAEEPAIFGDSAFNWAASPGTSRDDQNKFTVTENSDPDAPQLTSAICARIAAGETLRQVCRDPAMPAFVEVRGWAARQPQFAADLAAARRSAAWGDHGASVLWCETTAQEILVRLGEGETLTAICADPAMPSMMTVHRWREARLAFDKALALAQGVAAERLADLGLQMALAGGAAVGDPKGAASGETAAMLRVKLAQLRWTAASRDPLRFGARKPVAAPEPPPRPTNIAFKQFHLERREDGMFRVVTLMADIDSNLPVRVNEGPWTRVHGAFVQSPGAAPDLPVDAPAGVQGTDAPACP